MTQPPDPARISAVVLAGGRASRLGGISKPDLAVNGVPLLQIALAATRAAGASPTIVVGPPALAAREAIRVAEDPPFGGPVAGLHAGLAELDRLGGESEWVLVLPVDLPRADDAVQLLLRAWATSAANGTLDRSDGLHLVDAGGQAQWLTALYRRTALRTALGTAEASRGRAVKAVVGALSLIAVPDPGAAGADIDTWDDLARQQAEPASAQPTGGTMTDAKPTSDQPPRDAPDLTAWISALATELGIDAALVDVPALLAVAGDVAHNVARPAAPVTTFAVALAALQNGGDLAAVQRAAAQVSALAKSWPASDPAP